MWPGEKGLTNLTDGFYGIADIFLSVVRVIFLS